MGSKKFNRCKKCQRVNCSNRSIDKDLMMCHFYTKTRINEEDQIKKKGLSDLKNGKRITL